MAVPRYREDRPLEDLNTRARIRDAAMAEFAEKGFRGATMRGIASAAGVSVGLIQHHFGTKDGLRAACDELILDTLRTKTDAVNDGTIADAQVLAGLMAVAPRVQRYVARALVDSSPDIVAMVDEVMSRAEEFLTAWWPERFSPDSARTRDAAAVMTALNTSTMVLQTHLCRRMGLEPWSEEALQRIGLATFDVWETIADFTGSELWRNLRGAVHDYPRGGTE